MFNGIGDIMPEMEGEHKTALVSINSSKSQTLFDYVKNYTIYRESCDLQIANGKLIES
jgi:hypothetical protein